ncbi:MAG: hypothetical protein WCD18_11315 [Thermosynechococcaceae cyanobacterium]
MLLLTLPLATVSVIQPEIAQAGRAHSATSARKPLPAKSKQKSLRLNAKSPKTAQPAQLAGLAGATVTPILTSGDTLSSGFQFAGIPDGLGAYTLLSGTNQFTLLVNHELSSASVPPNISDARVSKLIIDKNTLEVKSGGYLINGTEGYRRFCSASLGRRVHGFSGPMFLTNEEATDGPKKGISVAVNPITGVRTDLPWVGYMSHENTTPIPGYNKIVLITSDDNGTK